MYIFSYFSQNLQIAIISMFALIFGSFASLLSYRLANKQPIVFTRSKCLSCGVILKPLNLIPLFSWIFQRGKCSKCHAKISIRYPLIELSFLISFLTIYFVLKQELNWKMLVYFSIAGTLIVMTIIDIEEYFIPNSTQYFLAILATILVVLDGGTSGILNNIKAAVLYAGFGGALYLFFYVTTKLEAIGVDDIKFLFVAGLMIGLKSFLAFTMLSGIFGILFGVVWQKVKKDETFPFAPALCLALFLCLLFGKKIDPIELMGKFLL